ncbi:Separase [Psidium guajava]|nr:Separase [Psidium guajava]
MIASTIQKIQRRQLVTDSKHHQFNRGAAKRPTECCNRETEAVESKPRAKVLDLCSTTHQQCWMTPLQGSPTMDDAGFGRAQGRGRGRATWPSSQAVAERSGRYKWPRARAVAERSGRDHGSWPTELAGSTGRGRASWPTTRVAAGG